MTWPVRPLREVADVVRGVTYRKTQARDRGATGYVPLLRATNIGNSLDLAIGLIYVPESVVKGKQRLQPWDIVLASSSGSLSVVGKSAPLPHAWDGTFGAFCAVIRSSPRIDARYLSLYLRSHAVRSRWSEAARGTNINNLKRGDLDETPVPVPSLDEQRHIVDLLEDHLSRLDAADRWLSVSLAKLKALRERTILHALTAADASARVAPSLAEVGTDDGVVPSLPVGWSWARLGDVAHVVGGVTKDSKKQSDPSFIEVPYLRVANVQRGHLNVETVTRIRVNPAKAKALTLEHGDVLLNEGGDRDKLARGWVWEGQVEDCIHQNHVFRARLHEDRLDPYFLSWTTNSFGGPWAERNGKQSVNLASISLSMVKKMPVIVPAAGKAEEVVVSLSGTLTTYDRLAAALKSARQRGTVLRQSLLEAAFSGRLTSDHLDHELGKATL